ncbi:NUDIX domain-containing protein [Chitinophaga japonensis]|uniref:Putative NUDIX family NTP pyrophosphohydrolase n=1 Tax=Chitinophaga japonensis TaxID=104662 RepID=A0A562TDI0_CHIJA|nr:NUDIX domain-containing protein [Chitinophaga japonensis]TWI91617.1 putative NUDIX family NTP pyrophosphohydrolase [Chitinophaga japonensis]
MGKTSAGILLYRYRDQLQVLLVHPGGPFWAKKDAGAWSIPKGEAENGDGLLSAALREFEEETGMRPAADPDTLLPLEPVKQKGGKLVHAWALQGDLDTTDIRSNTFEMEWPPRSGKTRSFPEVDKAAWLPIPEARQKILAGQLPLIDQLLSILPDTPLR